MWRPFAAVGIFLVVVSQASAAPVNSSYFTRVWQTEKGLPQNEVTAVLQTHDGYIWVGTYNGLARFDGEHFKVFNTGNTPEMHSSRVTCLYEDRDWNLWIGQETGDVARYRDGHFEAVNMAAIPWESGTISDISSDDTGDIWLLQEKGLLARLRDGTVLSPPAGDATRQLALARDWSGANWIARAGRVSVLKHGQLSGYDFDGQSDAGYVQGLCASRDGGLWVSADSRLRKWHNGKWSVVLNPAPWGLSSVKPMLETRSGWILAGTTDSGIYFIKPYESIVHLSRTNGLSHDWVRSMCEDREGDIWAGIGSGGLVELCAGKVGIVNPPDHWQGRPVLSVYAARDDSLWMGSEGAGLYRLRGGEWTHFGEAEGILHPFVWSVTEDAQGRIWAGTWGGGLFRENGNQFDRVYGLGDVTVMTALTSGRTGEMWLGTDAGVGRYQDEKAEWYGHNRDLASTDVRAVAVDTAGTVWFGMFGGGLGCLTNGVVRQYHKRDGLSSDFVQALHFDKQGALWIGTFGGGLNRMKQGRISVIGSSQGLPDNVICHIEEDDRGNFWMSSFGGVLRAAKSELDSCADGTLKAVNCQALGLGDGMPTLECSGGMQPSGAKTSDGRLWFPTSKGLVVVDPDNVPTNRIEPPVLIEQVQANGHVVFSATNGSDTLRIAPGQQRLDIDYTALSYVAPDKVKFRYRLEPLDSEWFEAGAKRSANYSYVPPGPYKFHVIACNNDGIWNSDGASLALIILPQFWQTWWFRAVTAAAAAGLVAGAVLAATRRRMRLKLERFERQRAIERERERIAKDIHDDLGASLTRISMLSQSARRDLDNPSEAAANLDRIYGTARELTRAMDEIVWAVNPKHDTLESLASYLGRFAQEYLSAAGVRCRLDLPAQLAGWTPTAEVRHNLFLAFKEAVHNIVKHAGATEAHVFMELRASELVLAVEDNGKGFEGKGNGAPVGGGDRLMAGNGLLNMHRRMAEIGGRCDIQSQPGQGARLWFFVPVQPVGKRHSNGAEVTP